MKKKRYLLLLSFLSFLTVGIVIIGIVLRTSHIPFNIIWQGLTDTSIPKQTDGRTNILIWGTVGKNDEGKDITGTILVISLPHQSGYPAIVLLPHNIWSETFQNTLDTVYDTEKQKEIVREVTGLPIHYLVTLDPTGVKSLIDLVGGVDVTIPADYRDAEYPFIYRPGTQHLYGEWALRYMKQDHTNEVLQAFFSAVKQTPPVMSFKLIPLTLTRLSHHMSTDISPAIGIAILRKSIGFHELFPIIQVSAADFMVNPPEELFNDQRVLIPKSSWNDFRTMIAASIHGEPIIKTLNPRVTEEFLPQ